MASNLVVARGGVEYVPPISLAFWRWTFVFIILFPFTYPALKKNYKVIKKEYKKLLFLGAMGCGVCGAFPFLAGQTITSQRSFSSTLTRNTSTIATVLSVDA